MKVEMSVTINIGNYENIKIGVSEMDSFAEAEKALRVELDKLNLTSKVLVHP